MARQLLDRQTGCWALVRRVDAANTKLAILVHGFRGTYLSTWGELGAFLKQSADADPVFAQWDFLFAGYESHTIASYIAIADLVRTHWKNAAAAQSPFTHGYEKLALFGHSLGTLGIRQLLCIAPPNPAGLIDALHSVTLLGAPQNGSPWAGAAGLFRLADAFKHPAALRPGSYPIKEALKPDNPQLQMLKSWNEAVRYYRPDLVRPRVILGADDLVVGAGEAWEGDDRDMTAYRHLNIAALASEEDDGRSDILDFLRRGLR